MHQYYLSIRERGSWEVMEQIAKNSVGEQGKSKGRMHRCLTPFKELCYGLKIFISWILHAHHTRSEKS
jgi:hypothetical protein